MARNKRRSSRKGSSLFWLFIAGFVAYKIYDVFFPPVPPPPPVATVQPSAPAVAPAVVRHQRSLYGLRPMENSWPPITAQAESAVDTNSLLTTNYFIMLDASGSMAEQKCSGTRSKMQVAASALGEFVRSLPAQANFGLAIFNGTTTKELLPLGHHDGEEVKKIAAQILPSASTPLASAMSFSYEKIAAQARRQLGYGEYYLVLITDGLANRGQEPDGVVRRILEQSPVQIYTIGFCISEDHPLHQPGRTVYRSANDPQALVRGLKDILAEAPEFNIVDFKQ